MEIGVEWYYTGFSQDFNCRKQVFPKSFFLPEKSGKTGPKGASPILMRFYFSGKAGYIALSYKMFFPEENFHEIYRCTCQYFRRR